MDANIANDNLLTSKHAFKFTDTIIKSFSLFTWKYLQLLLSPLECVSTALCYSMAISMDWSISLFDLKPLDNMRLLERASYLYATRKSL